MTRIVVPTAQTAPGRNAVALTPEPQGGAIVAEFGRRMSAIGGALEADRLDRQMARLQVDIEKDLAQARLEAEEIGQPDQLEAFWSQRSETLRKSYLGAQGEDGRPRVDPRNTERFGLAFDSVANRHAATIGARALEARRSERVALFTDWEAAVTPVAARGTPDETAAILDEFDLKVEEQVAAGIVDAATAAEMRRSKRAELAGARATYLLSADPARLSAAVDAGELDALDAQTQQEWKARADKALATAEDRATRELAQAEADRLAEVKRLAGEAVDLAGRGQRSALEDQLLADPAFEAKYPVEHRRLSAASRLRDARGDLKAMTLPELRALRTELENAPKTEDFDADALMYVDELIAAAEKGWREDPMQFAIDTGLPGFDGLALPEDVLADPAATAAALDLFARRGAQLMGDTLPNGTALPSYLDRPPAVALPRSEQERIKAALVPGAGDPAQQAELTAALVENLGPGALSAIGLDPEVVFAGGMIAAGQPAELANSILRGRQKLAQDTAIAAPLREAVTVFRERMGPLFDAMPGGARVEEQLLQAATAAYAARHPIPPDRLMGDEFETTFRQVLHEVSGGTGTVGRRDQTGGIAEINGADTFLPTGMSPDLAQDALDGLADLLSGREFDLSGAPASPQWQAADRIVAAAAGGASLRLNGLELTGSDWQNVVLVPIGQDRYQLKRLVEGRELTVTDATTGAPAAISLVGLARTLADEEAVLAKARDAASAAEDAQRLRAVQEAPAP